MESILLNVKDLAVRELDGDEGTDVDEIYLHHHVKDNDDGTDVDQIYHHDVKEDDDHQPHLNYHDEGQVMHKVVDCSLTTSTEDSNHYRINKPSKKQPGIMPLDQNHCTVFVGNISYRITQRVLWDFFNTFGTVTKTHIVMDHVKYHRRSRGIGFVTFSSQAEARRVLTATEDELILDDRMMRVFPAERKKREIQHIHADQDQVNEEGGKGGEKQEEFVSTPLIDIGHSQYDFQVDEAIVKGIHLLPNDVLLYIFSFLGLKDKVQVERVCKRWQSVVLQSWQSLEKLDINGVFGGFMDNMLTDNILRLLLKKGCRNLKELDLSPSPYLLTDWAVELIGQRCKKLVKLDLTSVRVTKSSLKFLSSSCNQLTWIRLKKCNGFGEKGLWWLFHHCKLLEYVDLTANYRISGQCFYMLSEKLGVLILDECSSVTDEGLKHVVNKCPRLEHLDLRGCVSITATSVECLSKGLRHLKHFILNRFYPKIDGEGSLSFLGLNSLEVLVITHNSLLTDATILNVCKSNTRLRCLNIEGSVEAVSDMGVKAITTYCRDLEELNISYISKISADGYKSLSMLTNLKTVIMKGCHQLSDEALMTIGSACLDLELVDVSGCVNITEVSVKVIVDIHSEENTSKTMRLNIGATGVNADCLKALTSTHSNIQISTCLTILERFTQQDDCIILGGAYTDDEEDGGGGDDDEDLGASNYRYFKTERHDDYHDDSHDYHEASHDYHDYSHDYHEASHGYHEDFLEADDPFMEYEEWDLS